MNPVILFILLLLFQLTRSQSGCGSISFANPKIAITTSSFAPNAQTDSSVYLDIAYLNTSSTTISFTSILLENSTCDPFEAGYTDYFKLAPYLEFQVIVNASLRINEYDRLCYTKVAFYQNSSPFSRNFTMNSNYFGWESGNGCVRFGPGYGTELCSNVYTGSFLCVCDAGQVPSPINGLCMDCLDPGFSSNPGDTSCSKCPRGKFIPASGSKCIDCSPGKSSGIGSVQCTDCISGKFSNVFGGICLNCTAGTFSVAGRTSCTNCTSGKYSNPGESFCKNCTTGLYSLSGQACQKCPAGKSSNDGDSACKNCSLNHYSHEGEICRLCPEGKQSSIGAPFCDNCTTGRYSNPGGSCIQCQTGRYSSSLSLSFCSFCEAGRFGSNIGLSICDRCEPGSFSILGAPSCEQCSQGRFSTDSLTCSVCPKGKFSNNKGASICQDCEFSMTDSEGSISPQQCTTCISGYYGSPPGKPCLPCPTSPGAICPGPTERPIVTKGYFRISDAIVAPCSPEDSCLETGVPIMTPCAVGYSGSRCGVCDSNFYRSNLVCKECPSKLQQYLVISAFAFVLLVLLYKFATSSALISKEFRISLQALQFMALFSTISSNWPPQLLTLFSILSFSNVNIEIISPECSVPMSFWDKYLIKSVIPFALFGFLVFLDFLKLCSKKMNKAYVFIIAKKIFLEHIIPISSTIVVTLFTLIISNAFSPLNCTFDESSKSYIMWKNPSQNCFDKMWFEKLPIIVCIAIIYVIIVPSFFILLFIKNRKDPCNPRFRNLFGALISPYKVKYFYWELIIMLKRGSFIVINQLGSLSANYLARFGSSVCILAFFGAIEALILPYNSSHANVVNNTWNVILIMILLCQGLVFEAHDGVLAFTIFAFFIISIVSLTLLILFFQTIKNLQNRDSSAIQSILISKQIFSMLTKDVRNQIITIHSDSVLKENGSLVLYEFSPIISKEDISNIRENLSAVKSTQFR